MVDDQPQKKGGRGRRGGVNLRQVEFVSSASCRTIIRN